jgi:AraC-like DNA-binding protein
MGETLFSFNRRNFRKCQDKFRGEREQEYYRGDFWIGDSGTIDVRSERKCVGPFAIIRQRSATNLFFRRTRQHIREDATDLSILWFVKFGKIAFSNQCGTQTVPPGGFAITRSMAPFFMECQIDEDSVHEVLHMTVPTHILRELVPCEGMNGFFHIAKGRELAIAENILTDVFEDDGMLVQESARLLVDAALSLIGSAVRGEADGHRRQTIIERRQADLMRFIEVHLSNPHLSPRMAAKGCGISPRYLSNLLQLRGTTFSELVWEQRLEKARHFLASDSLFNITIAEIAYDLGFKSPSHFSRMFKRVFKVNPSDFRNHHREQFELGQFRAPEGAGTLLQ